MISNLSGVIRIAPLLILRFPLLAPKKFQDAQKFNLRFSDPSQMTETADKLRWYRYKNALLQSDIADAVGIDCKTYMRYEEYGKDYYPIEHMKKLAEFYDVPLEDLLDEYNLFLFRGQGKQIQFIRLSRNMTQKTFAVSLGVRLENLKRWEQGRVQVSKTTWERYFKDAAKKKAE